jgi:hypothetical protein
LALYDTVLNVVADAAVECGLAAPSVVMASTDANVVLLRTLLKRVGRKLALGYEWKQLRVEYTFTTTTATSYALPADFSRMIDQSAWNRTSDRPGTPVGAETWQALKATDSGIFLTALFRPLDTTIELWPQPPTSGDTIAFEYLSRYWVGTTGLTTKTLDAPAADTNIIYFDATLMVAALVLAFKAKRGFDTTEAQQEYDETLALVKSANTNAAPVLSLGGNRSEEPFIGEGSSSIAGVGGTDFGGLY